MKPKESNKAGLAWTCNAATNVPHIAPDIARPVRSITCATRLISNMSCTRIFLSFNMVGSSSS
jgi:hypothetical protein